MMCRNCMKKTAIRPRGLCWTCYYDPAIRERYPSTSKFARRGIVDRMGVVPLPPSPSDALPGSEAKVQVLAERAQLHQSLFHPDDATLDSSPSRRRVFRLAAAV